MHDQLVAVAVFLAGASATLCASAQALPSLGDGAALAKQAAERQPGLTKGMLRGRQFRFSWKTDRDSSHIGTATLREDGTIAGIASPNETFWLIDGEGRVIFKERT
jgi:hypothetical protein